MAGLGEALVLMAAATVGPLLTQGETGVCSAFLAQSHGQSTLYTAAHCVGKTKPQLWLPGLEGNALNLKQSRWTTVSAVQPSQWRAHPWQDLAWKAGSSATGGPRLAALPSPGAEVTVVGYPEGKGPVVLRCKYAGVAILDDRSRPRLRPALDCPPPKGFDRYTGFSGGPVLDGNSAVVGVLVSGNTLASGRIRPGFEPLLPWLREGRSTHRVALPWESQETHWVEVVVSKDQVIQFQVRSNDGTVWSQWPAVARRQGR